MRIVLKICGIVLLSVATLALLFLLIMLLTEYRQATTETVAVVKGESEKTPATGENLTVVTWNTGFGALGDNADFFMDGGTMVRPSDEDRVRKNTAAIADRLENLGADIIFLQETDANSTRTYGFDETEYYRARFQKYSASFAPNWKTLFVPYPIPPIGRVESGIMTLCTYGVSEATRCKLPCPFTFPVSAFNLKRCLLVSRVPVSDSDRELVLVNLHLEAYDSGEGKVEQTGQLKELLESESAKGNYVIAGGDFNQSFSSTDTSMYPLRNESNWVCPQIDTSVFGAGLQFFMDNTTPTCRLLNRPYAGADPDTFQYYMLDGFIVSGNITVNRCETVDAGFVNSDHNPVLINITLN